MKSTNPTLARHAWAVAPLAAFLLLAGCATTPSFTHTPPEANILFRAEAIDPGPYAAQFDRLAEVVGESEMEQVRMLMELMTEIDSLHAWISLPYELLADGDPPVIGGAVIVPATSVEQLLATIGSVDIDLEYEVAGDLLLVAADRQTLDLMVAIGTETPRPLPPALARHARGSDSVAYLEVPETIPVPSPIPLSPAMEYIIITGRYGAAGSEASYVLGYDDADYAESVAHLIAGIMGIAPRYIDLIRQVAQDPQIDTAFDVLGELGAGERDVRSQGTEVIITWEVATSALERVLDTMIDMAGELGPEPPDRAKPGTGK